MNPFSFGDAFNFVLRGSDDYGTTSFPQDQWNAENFYNRTAGSMWNNIRAEALADRDYNSMREDTYYQRMMNSMQQAGINPLIAFAQGGVPSMPSNANSQTAGSFSKANEITKLWEDVREQTQRWGVDYMERVSKIFKNFTSGVSIFQ